MERRKWSGMGLLKAAALGALVFFAARQAYDIGDGVARYGGLGEYWESRQQAQELRRAVDLINRYYVDGPKVEMDALTRSALEKIVDELGDPYSEYLGPEAMDRLREETDQEFGGIGIRVEMKDDRLTIVAPIEGTPGARAGLLRGDQIVAVDGSSIEGSGMREAINLLRGPPGSSVALSVHRPRNGERFDAQIRREAIAVQNVKDARMIEPGIGYLRILQFGARTAEEMRSRIDALVEQGMVALVLDLRNNPGGLLDAAVEVASPFLKPGELIVYTEGRHERQTERWEAAGGGRRYDFPLALLVNSGSASASEIVAGALKDAGRATLVGDKTFGKGSVQTILGLGGASGLRLTTAKYYTPGGYVIDGQGIEPDVKVELSVEEDRKLAIQRNGLEFLSPEEFALEFEFEPISDRQLEAAVGALREVRHEAISLPDGTVD